MTRRTPAPIALIATLALAACSQEPSAETPAAVIEIEPAASTAEAASSVVAEVASAASEAEPEFLGAFRATGNEPFWLLSIGQETIILTTPDDELVMDGYVIPVVEGKRATFKTAELAVTLEREPCQNSMSGAMLDYTVSVEVRGALLTGCGSRLPG